MGGDIASCTSTDNYEIQQNGEQAFGSMIRGKPCLENTSLNNQYVQRFQDQIQKQNAQPVFELATMAQEIQDKFMVDDKDSEELIGVKFVSIVD